MVITIIYFYRSGLLLPSAYVFSCSFIHDLYRMFRRFKLSRIHYKDQSNLSLAVKMMRHQLSFVLHHVLLFTFGIIIAVSTVYDMVCFTPKFISK